MTDETPEHVDADDEAPLVVRLLEELLGEVRQARADVVAERRGRRGSRILAVVAIAVLAIGLAVGAKAYVDQGRITCDSRAASRDDVRVAIAAAVDEVARYADVEPVERRQLSTRVQRRVAAELPAPSCEGPVQIPITVTTTPTTTTTTG